MIVAVRAFLAVARLLIFLTAALNFASCLIWRAAWSLTTWRTESSLARATGAATIDVTTHRPISANRRIANLLFDEPLGRRVPRRPRFAHSGPDRGCRFRHDHHASQTDDAAQLAELGYESRFERRMGLWENFALGFTYLSPVVGVYSTFALAFVAGGPPMIWSIVIAGARPAAGRAGVLRDRRPVPGRRRRLPVGAAADRAPLGVDHRLDLRLGADRHGRQRVHRRGAVHRLAVRLHADPRRRR